MSYDPEIHHRRSIRLKGYDYSRAGAYFITICTHDRKCVLGEVIDGQMHLNQFGKIVASEWLKTGEVRENVELDVSVVMPNHMHGILIITHQIETVGAAGLDQFPDAVGQIDAVGATRRVAPTDSDQSPDVDTGHIEAAESSDVTNSNQATESKTIDPATRILKPGSLGAIMAQFQSIATKKIRKAGLRRFKWQRGYYEHIIRNERALERIRYYIINNPANWEHDQENRNNISAEEKKRFWKKYLDGLD